MALQGGAAGLYTACSQTALESGVSGSPWSWGPHGRLSLKGFVGTTSYLGTILGPAHPDFLGGSGRGSKDPRRDDVTCEGFGGRGQGSRLRMERKRCWSFTAGGAVGV